MIDAKLVAMTLTIGMVVSVALHYNDTRSVRADAVEYTDDWSVRLTFICDQLPDTDGCTRSLCTHFEAGTVNDNTLLNIKCPDGTSRAASLLALGTDQDWYERALGSGGNTESPAAATVEWCLRTIGENDSTGFDFRSGDEFDASCAAFVPVLAASVNAEYTRYVTRAHIAYFKSGFDMFCKLGVDGVAGICDGAKYGFGHEASFQALCEDGQYAEFKFLETVVELDKLAADGTDAAAITAFIEGHCPAPAEDPQTDDPDGQCIADAGCDGSSCDDIGFAACAAASGCEGAAAMCVPDDGDGDDDRRLAVDTDTMFDFLDEETVESTETKKPRSLGELLKKEHGAAKAKNILELRASLHERKQETGADSRELGWAHWGGRRRRWGPYTHHHHLPHYHNPHHHNPHAHGPAITNGQVDVCPGCANRCGNACFGRCGAGCGKWNACGGAGMGAHRACVEHDFECSCGTMLQKSCVALMWSGDIDDKDGCKSGSNFYGNRADCDLDNQIMGEFGFPKWLERLMNGIGKLSGAILGSNPVKAHYINSAVRNWGKNYGSDAIFGNDVNNGLACQRVNTHNGYAGSIMKHGSEVGSNNMPVLEEQPWQGHHTNIHGDASSLLACDSWNFAWYNPLDAACRVYIANSGKR